ncbi:hypothetical protein YYC_04859 [Plasmodium yoelii 17X]|uniref:Uncharacterized protein n=2 Tax=Plasmodium yoelii TaxID=5861 RepID=A0A077Y240_PLAYE|nr:conserved Plasmodium protein, unknown function [Plasmodium yoelii]ETB57355.1 hypothetical protein YYC_04859 [Plasmodium yoelii 17X]CDU16907.1 conserved Plasmodium protein, unknown function [Plasmodium yoelii]VTZ75188.1 conserved Plasmodium protein, unknown function [Plasmodium yoelii]|eukprot:XP_022813131.1 conserved Plasmodium protein, unknown function [Plasmodium yoelii]
MNLDKLEKERLMQRREKHVKHILSDNIIKDIKYKDNDKFYQRKRDAEYDDYLNRQHEKLKMCIQIENRRKENLERNEKRWELAEINERNEREKTNKLQKMPFKSEKNKSKCGHDIINHNFVTNEEKQKHEIKKNAMLRRQNYLSEKTNSSYNPITGEKRV